jgi:predicted extracellular nuclease
LLKIFVILDSNPIRMFSKSQQKEHLYTVAFYNLENLFDTINDPKTLDDDFTEGSFKNWNENRFEQKIKKLGKVISQIGFDEIGYPPVLLGVAEVENRAVLEELVASKYLRQKEYGIVHFDSPDERGIDTALLYRKQFFKVLEKYSHEVYITNERGERDFTRDILHVEGVLQTARVHLLVNHWPSRRSGTDETSTKRVTASERMTDIIQNIRSKDMDARIIVMGDFNDDPKSESIQRLIHHGLYNPMEVLLTSEIGSLSHQQTWHLFDQILISHNFLEMHENPFRFEKAKIHKPLNIQEYKGKFKGVPFRTYIGKKYIGGVSDHFPVFGVFSCHS